MGTYTIGEAAERSGFSASALRYYEGIGLVAPAARTGAGYRVYDDRSLARLGFIARAKQLGCSLEEVIALVALWDGQRCGPVQRRLHDLVTAKIWSAQRQRAELTAFTAQLRAAAVGLSGEPVDEPCGDGCACLVEPAQAAVARAARAVPEAEPGAAPDECRTPAAEPPIACSLDGGAVAERLAEWQPALARVGERSTTGDGALRLTFDDTIDVGELAALVAAEQRCCGFFAFALTVDGRGVALEVRAPDAAADVTASLFGTV